VACIHVDLADLQCICAEREVAGPGAQGMKVWCESLKSSKFAVEKLKQEVKVGNAKGMALCTSLKAANNWQCDLEVSSVFTVRLNVSVCDSYELYMHNVSAGQAQTPNIIHSHHSN
jgi:hypothetical protein